jgi:bacteriorhodopsin
MLLCLQLLGEEEKEIGRLYRQLLALFVICWTIYPILFIVGHNGGVVGYSTVLEVITVPLEIVAKGLAGIVVCASFCPHQTDSTLFVLYSNTLNTCMFPFSICADCLHVSED